MFTGDKTRKPRSDKNKRRSPPRDEVHIQARLNASGRQGTPPDPRVKDAVGFWRTKRRTTDASRILIDALLALREKEERGYKAPVATPVQMHAATLEVFEQLRVLAERLQHLDLSGASTGARQAVTDMQREASHMVNAVNLIGAVEIADDEDDWD